MKYLESFEEPSRTTVVTSSAFYSKYLNCTFLRMNNRKLKLEVFVIVLVVKSNRFEKLEIENTKRDERLPLHVKLNTKIHRFHCIRPYRACSREHEMALSVLHDKV